MSKKQYLTLSLLSILLFAGVTYLAAYNGELKAVAGSIIYFFTCFYFFRKYPSAINNLLLIFIAPYIVLILPFRVINFLDTSPTLFMDVAVVLSILGAYLFCKGHKYFVPIFLAIGLGFYFFITPLFSNKVDFGSYSQVLKVKTKAPDFQLVNRKGESFTNKNLSGVTIFDFWTIGCASCYRSFSKIDNLVKKGKFNNVDLFVTFIPPKFITDNQDSIIHHKLDKHNYQFNQLFAQDKKYKEVFQIAAYPTTIIIKEGFILFRGSFDGCVKYLEKEGYI